MRFFHFSHQIVDKKLFEFPKAQYDITLYTG